MAALKIIMLLISLCSIDFRLRKLYHLHIVLFILLILCKVYLLKYGSGDLYRYNEFLKYAKHHSIPELFTVTGWEPVSIIVLKFFSILSLDAKQVLAILLLLLFLIVYTFTKNVFIAYLATSPLILGSTGLGSIRTLISIMFFMLFITQLPIKSMRWPAMFLSLSAHKVILTIIPLYILKQKDSLYLFLITIMLTVLGYTVVSNFDLNGTLQLLIGDRFQVLNSQKLVPTALLLGPIIIFAYFSFVRKDYKKYVALLGLIIIFSHPFVNSLQLYLRAIPFIALFLIFDRTIPNKRIKQFFAWSISMEICYFILPYESMICYYTGADFCGY